MEEGNMKGYTKKALLLLMIAQILAMVTIIFLYLTWFSINPETVSSDNFSFPLLLIPVGVIGVIASLIVIIGAIFFLMGSKEFGEPHKRFVFYAIIVFILYIVVVMAITTFTAFLTFATVSQTLFTQNTAMNQENITQLFSVTLITSPLMAIMSGLIWVFGLYHLENKKGRMVLFSAYIWMIAIAIITSISSYYLFTDWVATGYFENLSGGSGGSSSYSQLVSSSQWIGTTGVISLIGMLIQNMLFFFALYIPYQRISSGDLVPVESTLFSSITDSSSTHQQRRCPNCGRGIPFDALVCPYCGKKYDSF
jgi:hypothetical protein